MSTLWTAFKMTVVLTVLTGLIYPLLIVGAAHVLFPWQANGSLVVRDGKAVGSALIGQNFASPRYFHSRPSAAGDKGYDASNSGGSNLGPTNKALIDAVRTRLVAEVKPGLSASQVPVDLVTASGSGLDPEISPAAAEIQVGRVATARGLNKDQVGALVRAHTRPRWAGIFGEPGVNVVMLNLALDNLSSGKQSAAITGGIGGGLAVPSPRFARFRDVLGSSAALAGRFVLAAVPIVHPAVPRQAKPVSAEELLLALLAIAVWAIALAGAWLYVNARKRKAARRKIHVIYEEAKLGPEHKRFRLLRG